MGGCWLCADTFFLCVDGMLVICGVEMMNVGLDGWKCVGCEDKGDLRVFGWYGGGVKWGHGGADGFYRGIG